MDEETAFDSRADLASYDAVDLGERMADYIQNLRMTIVMQQERIDMLQRGDTLAKPAQEPDAGPRAPS